MRSLRLVAALLVVGASLPAVTLSCGPSCIDDRCSLKPATPQTTRVDYTSPKTTSSPGTVTTGSAAPVTSAGSGSQAPVVVASGAGSGSAAPVVKPPPAAGSGSGSAAPVAPPKPVEPTSAVWETWSGNQFKMYAISKTALAAGAKLTFEIIKAPTKTPFVITLEVLPPGGVPGAEGVWNDCPENKIRCDSPGVKTHVTKKAGQVLIQAGINWVVTGAVDDSKGTLVTWTNSLSREALSLRLAK